MKFTLSVAVLALAASQAMAVVPTPKPNCTKSVVVQEGVPGCDAFAATYGVTFADLLKWNDKLSPKCDNLDVGHPICVAVTGPSQPPITPTGGVAVPTTSGAAVVPTTTAPAVVPTGTATNAPVVTTTTAAAGATRTTTAAAPAPTGAAVANKGSFLVAAAGVVLSAAYLL